MQKIYFFAIRDTREEIYRCSVCVYIYVHMYVYIYMVESSDKTWSTEEGNCKQLQYSCLENAVNNMKRHKDMTLKDELPRSIGTQNATGEERRNNSRNNERWIQVESNSQVWMLLVMVSNAVQSNAAQEPGMLGP